MKSLRNVNLRGAVAGLALALAAGLMVVPPMLAAPAHAQEFPSVADLAEKLLPAVVEIAVETNFRLWFDCPGHAGASGKFAVQGFLRRFLQAQSTGWRAPGQGRPRSVSSLGSGFIIDASGLIVTNNHVVEGANRSRSACRIRRC